MAWRTTELADEDVADAEAFGTVTFGRRHAEVYVDGMFAAFDLIAANPKIAPERDEVDGGVRLYNYRSHRIFYVIDGDHVLVVRVLHASRDWPDWL